MVHCPIFERFEAFRYLEIWSRFFPNLPNHLKIEMDDSTLNDHYFSQTALMIHKTNDKSSLIFATHLMLV